MEIYVARQPIISKNGEVFAYELFYRNGTNNYFPAMDGDRATFNLIIHSYLDIGLDELTNGKPYFINFTEASLDLDMPACFGANEMIIELLKTVHLSKKVVEKCHKFKHLGYHIALDGYFLKSRDENLDELLQVVDYIKVDFLATAKDERRMIERKAFGLNVCLIGEKIETDENFNEAVTYGYTYFQGYYFEKPTIVCSKIFPPFFYLRNLPIHELSLDELTELIEGDLPLFFKLLKATHPIFRLKNKKMVSVHQFVKELGQIELKKWLLMIAAQENYMVANRYSEELIEHSLTRAKMCQAIAMLLNESLNESAYYTLGLLSLIDKIFDIPIEQLVEYPFHENLIEALVGTPNTFNHVLDLVLAIEKADWQTIACKCKELNINEKDVFKLYAESITWSKEQISFRNNLFSEAY